MMMMITYEYNNTAKIPIRISFGYWFDRPYTMYIIKVIQIILKNIMIINNTDF